MITLNYELPEYKISYYCSGEIKFISQRQLGNEVKRIDCMKFPGEIDTLAYTLKINHLSIILKKQIFFSLFKKLCKTYKPIRT